MYHVVSHYFALGSSAWLAACYDASRPASKPKEGRASRRTVIVFLSHKFAKSRPLTALSIRPSAIGVLLGFKIHNADAVLYAALHSFQEGI